MNREQSAEIDAAFYDYDSGGYANESETKFCWNEAEDSDKFQRLYMRDQGRDRSNKDLASLRRAEDRERLLSTLGGHLELTDRQRDRAEYLIGEVDMTGVSTTAWTLAAISMAANEDRRRIRREDQWNELRKEYGVRKNSIRNCRKKLHKHL